MFAMLSVLILTSCCSVLLVESKKNQQQYRHTVEKFIDPHFVNGHEGIVQLFEWKYEDIANECETFLGPKRFGGVQISPPNENVIIPGRPWYERYQPMSYLLNSRSGTERDFLDMTTRCNAVGVRIYSDVVFNHMAANQMNETAAIGTGGSKANPAKRDYPAVPYNVSNFHPLCALNDYQNVYQVRNCELVGLHDLNQTLEDTRSRIVQFLNHLIDLGVAGFRVDAAKHMWPSDLKIIYNSLQTLNSSFGFTPEAYPFIYQEVIDNGGEAISKYEYTFAAVSEFRYSSELSRCFSGNDDLRWLKTFGELWSLLPTQFALVFINNHDNQRSGNILTYKSKKKYIMAQAFSLAHPYGIKRIMSSFAFNKSGQGPPADANETILTPITNSNGQCINGWVCEHRWRQSFAMIEFMNTVHDTNITYWWDNQKNQIAFSRDNKGFIAFNLNDGDMHKKMIKTGLSAGVYCDVITGEKIGTLCTGKSIVVNDHGIAEISLRDNDENGVIAIHIGTLLINLINNEV
ncbi:unnamed protein product [Diamesa serratosioi]